MVGYGCGIGMENIITMTAYSRQIKGVAGVTWSGCESVIITEQNSMFDLTE